MPKKRTDHFNETIHHDVEVVKQKKSTAKPSTSWWVGLDQDRFYDRVRAESERLASLRTSGVKERVL